MPAESKVHYCNLDKCAGEAIPLEVWEEHLLAHCDNIDVGQPKPVFEAEPNEAVAEGTGKTLDSVDFTGSAFPKEQTVIDYDSTTESTSGFEAKLTGTETSRSSPNQINTTPNSDVYLECGLCEQTLNIEEIEDHLKAHEIQEQENDLALRQLPSSSSNAAAAIHSSAALTAEDSLSEDGDVADEEEFECVICRQKLNAAEVADHAEAHNIQHQENEPCTTTASSQTCSDNLTTCFTSTYDENGETKCGICEQTLNTEQIEDHLKAHEIQEQENDLALQQLPSSSSNAAAAIHSSAALTAEDSLSEDGDVADEEEFECVICRQKLNATEVVDHAEAHNIQYQPCTTTASSQTCSDNLPTCTTSTYDETKCGICEQMLNTEQMEDHLKAHEIQEQENDLALQQLPSSSSNAAAAIHSSAALTAEDSPSEDGDVADEEEFECVICRQKLNAAEVADHAEAHNIQHQENEPCTTTASSQTCSDNPTTCFTSTYDENGETKCGICEQTLNTEQIEDHLKAHEIQEQENDLALQQLPSSSSNAAAAIHSSAALTAEDSPSEDGDVADEEEFECVICRQKLNAAEVVDHVEAHNIQHQENEPCTTTTSSQTCSDNLPTCTTSTYDENGETKCGLCEQTLNTEQIEDHLKAHEIQEQENDLALQQLPSSSNAAAAIHSSAALTAEDSLSEDGDVADEEEFECVICRQKLNAAEVADHAEAHNIQHQENEPCTTTASSQTCSDNPTTCFTSTYDENGETKCGICEQTLNTEQIEDHLKAHEIQEQENDLALQQLPSSSSNAAAAIHSSAALTAEDSLSEDGDVADEEEFECVICRQKLNATEVADHAEAHNIQHQENEPCTTTASSQACSDNLPTCTTSTYDENGETKCGLCEQTLNTEEIEDHLKAHEIQEQENDLALQQLPSSSSNAAAAIHSSAALTAEDSPSEDGDVADEEEFECVVCRQKLNAAEVVDHVEAHNIQHQENEPCTTTTSSQTCSDNLPTCTTSTYDENGETKCGLCEQTLNTEQIEDHLKAHEIQEQENDLALQQLPSSSSNAAAAIHSSAALTAEDSLSEDGDVADEEEFECVICRQKLNATEVADHAEAHNIQHQENEPCTTTASSQACSDNLPTCTTSTYDENGETKCGLCEQTLNTEEIEDHLKAHEIQEQENDLALQQLPSSSSNAAAAIHSSAALTAEDSLSEDGDVADEEEFECVICRQKLNAAEVVDHVEAHNIQHQENEPCTTTASSQTCSDNLPTCTTSTYDENGETKCELCEQTLNTEQIEDHLKAHEIQEQENDLALQQLPSSSSNAAAAIHSSAALTAEDSLSEDGDVADEEEFECVICRQKLNAAEVADHAEAHNIQHQENEPCTTTASSQTCSDNLTTCFTSTYDENGETKCGICEQTLNTEQIEDHLKAHEIQEQENDLALQQLPSSSSNAAAAIHSSAALTAEDSLSEDGDVADEEEFECVICRQKLNATEVADHTEAHNIQHQENEPCTTTASSQACSDNLPTCTTSTYDENGETKCGLCEQTLNTEEIEDHLKAHEIQEQENDLALQQLPSSSSNAAAAIHSSDVDDEEGKLECETCKQMVKISEVVDHAEAHKIQDRENEEYNVANTTTISTPQSSSSSSDSESNFASEVKLGLKKKMKKFLNKKYPKCAVKTLKAVTEMAIDLQGEQEAQKSQSAIVLESTNDSTSAVSVSGSTAIEIISDCTALHIPEDWLDQVCSDEHLIQLARDVLDWEYVGNMLELRDTDLEDIESHRTMDMRKLMVFKKWKQCHYRLATYRKLFEIFIKFGKQRYVHSLKNILLHHAQ